MQQTPKVSVLMTVYNNERFLKEAMGSICSQTWNDFEFIIVNDASTDASRNVLGTYPDTRIRIIDNEKRLGLTASLNRGMIHCKGEYIARMDADDISLPHRLERQVAYLDNHPDVGVVGTFIKSMNAAGTITGEWKSASEDVQLRWHLLFRNIIAHPSALIRKSLLTQVNGYDESFTYAQDYALWTTLARLCKLHVIPEYLLLWRSHSQSTSSVKKESQGEAISLVMQKQINALLHRAINNQLIYQLCRMETGRPAESKTLLKQTELLLREIFTAYKKQHAHEKVAIKKALLGAKLIKLALVNARKYPWEAFSLLVRSSNHLGKNMLQDPTFDHTMKESVFGASTTQFLRSLKRGALRR